MDGEEEVLVRGGAEDVAYGPELPGPEGGLAEVPGPEDLHRDDAGDDILCQGLGTAELGDLNRRKNGTCQSCILQNDTGAIGVPGRSLTSG